MKKPRSRHFTNEAIDAGKFPSHISGSGSVKEKRATSQSTLGEKVWAVIADHYFDNNLTYDEARDVAALLKSKKQPGVVIVTNETAERMLRGSNFGIGVPALPDVKF